MGCGATSASTYKVGAASSETTEGAKRDSKACSSGATVTTNTGATEDTIDGDAVEALGEEKDSFVVPDMQESTADNEKQVKKIVRQSTGNLDQTSAAEQAAQKHANYMKRKQQRKARRQKQAQSEGNAFIPRNGFLSNVPETEVDLPYRFAFVVLGTFARELIEEVCNCNEALSYYRGLSSNLCVEEVDEEHLAAVQEHSFTQDFSDADSVPASGTLSVHERSFHDIANLASPRSSAATISASPRSSSIAISHGSFSNLDEHHLPDRSKSSASIKTAEAGTYRCICPVPYPWRKLNNKEGRKFAKLVFRPVEKQRMPTFDSMLEASSTAIVFALNVDSVEGSPSLGTQLENMLQLLKTRRQASREMRAKWAVVLWSRYNDDSIGVSEEKWAAWMKEVEDFEAAHGSMWRFDLIDVPEICKGDRLFAAFAKIASQRIYVNLNPSGECWESEASLKRELDDRGSEATEIEDDAPMYSAECDE